MRARRGQVEIDGVVYLRGRFTPGRFARARVTEVQGYELHAEPADPLLERQDQRVAEWRQTGHQQQRAGGQRRCTSKAPPSRPQESEAGEQQQTGSDQHHERNDFVLEKAGLLVDAPGVIDRRSDCTENAHRRPDHHKASRDTKTQACPLQRMRSHDLMQVFTEPCACGRTSFRFVMLGRSDDMFIVKGVNVFPLGIQATLMALHPRITGEFQVWLDKPPPIDYRVPIRVEVTHDVPAAAHGPLAREIAERLQREQNFSSAVTLVPQGSLATERKARRLVRAYQGEGAS